MAVLTISFKQLTTEAASIKSIICIIISTLGLTVESKWMAICAVSRGGKAIGFILEKLWANIWLVFV